MSFEVSGILEWAWAILQFTVDRVFLFCLIIFFVILLMGLSEQLANVISRLIARMRKGKNRVKRRTD